MTENRPTKPIAADSPSTSSRAADLDLVKGDRVDSNEWGILEGEILDFKICALVSEPNNLGRTYNWVPISSLTKASDRV